MIRKCKNSDTRGVTLVTNLMISHERGKKDGIVKVLSHTHTHTLSLSLNVLLSLSITVGLNCLKTCSRCNHLKGFFSIFTKKMFSSRLSMRVMHEQDVATLSKCMISLPAHPSLWVVIHNCIL